MSMNESECSVGESVAIVVALVVAVIALAVAVMWRIGSYD